MTKKHLAIALGLCAAAIPATDLAAETVAGYATKADYRAGRVTQLALEERVPEDGGDTCAAPTPIATVPFVDAGTTVGKTNTVGTLPLACNGNYTTVAGPDSIYSLTLGPGNNLTFLVTTTEANYDPSIYLLVTCNDGATCALGADNCFARNTAGNPCGAVSDEEFTASGLPPGTYYFYVDSFYSAASPLGAGPYSLSVTGTLGILPRTIGGTVSGLLGAGLVLQNNGGDDLPIAADGPFTFATPVNDGDPFDVTVLSQPTGPGQTCAVANGSGTVAGADVTNVTVTCVSDLRTVGGTVSGLLGTGLVLQNNGGDDLPIAADGPFTFATPVIDGDPFDVTVLSQPTGPGQTCAVANGSGTVAGADVTNVAVTCVSDLSILEIPTLGQAGIVLLVLLLAAIGILAMRSRVARN